MTTKVKPAKAYATRGLGRPSKYSEGVAAEITERVSNGESLLEICKSEHLPARSTVMQWIKNHEDFRTSIAYARAARGCTLRWKSASNWLMRPHPRTGRSRSSRFGRGSGERQNYYQSAMGISWTWTPPTRVKSTLSLEGMHCERDSSPPAISEARVPTVALASWRPHSSEWMAKPHSVCPFFLACLTRCGDGFLEFGRDIHPLQECLAAESSSRSRFAHQAPLSELCNDYSMSPVHADETTSKCYFSPSQAYPHTIL